MAILGRDLRDYKAVLLPDEAPSATALSDELRSILRRIGKADQKSSQLLELFRIELSDTLSENRHLVDDTREQMGRLAQQLQTVERGLLDYFDILDNLAKAAEMVQDRTFGDAIAFALTAKTQINERMGIQIVPGVGSKADAEVHFIVEARNTSTHGDDGAIAEVLEAGYRRGDRLLRKASVIVWRYKGE
jgi:molecular chaperone GrpE (heat shock protein)